jgi:hypothetical protein
MSDIRTRALQAANREGDGNVDPAGHTDPNARISLVYGCDVYSPVCETGLRYFEYSMSFTTDTTGALAEPADHLSTVDNLELVLDQTTGRCVRLLPLNPQERSRWSGIAGWPRRYELVDDKFYLYPKPPANLKITLRYIPQPPDLTSFGDSQVVDVVTPAGEGVIIWGSAANFMSKSASDLTFALSERDRYRAELVKWAQLRAFHEPARTYVEDDDDGFDRYRDGSWMYYR